MLCSYLFIAIFIEHVLYAGHFAGGGEGGAAVPKNESDIQFCPQSVIRLIWKIHSLIYSFEKRLVSLSLVTGIVRNIEDSSKYKAYSLMWGCGTHLIRNTK